MTEPHAEDAADAMTATEEPSDVVEPKVAAPAKAAPSRLPSSSVGAHRRPSHRARIPIVIWLAVVVQLLVGVAWSTLQLPYRAPDEAEHFDAIIYLTDHHDWPAPGALREAQRVTKTVLPRELSPAGSRAGNPVPRAQRPDLAIHGSEQLTGRPDQMTQHPPLYYAVMSTVLRVIPGWSHWNYDRVLALMRILSAVLIAPLPLLFWLAARRLTRSRMLALAAGLAPLLLPGLARTAGSVTNDSLEILLTTIAGYGIVRIATGDNSHRTAWWAGIATALDLLTKGTALAVVGWLALGYLWCWRRWRVPIWGALWRCAIPVGLGLLWWLRNVVRFGTIQPSPSALPAKPATAGIRHFLEVYLSGVSFRFWGSLGLPEPPQLDRTLSQIATFVALTLLVLGLFALRRAGGPVTGLVLLFGTLGFLGIITEGAYHTYRTTSVIGAEQGRYLYPVVLPLGLLAVAGLGLLFRGALRPIVPLIVGTLAAFLQIAAIAAAFRATWAPVPGASFAKAFHQLLLWAPWPATATKAIWVLLAAAALVLAGAALVSIVRGFRREERTSGTTIAPQAG